ncbi:MULTISPECIES: hypothetical protein [Methylobacterium]|uniref:hypothetical protein n=1 Tax=Methylobacterium TaxID=407 RepID=UPI0011CBDC52|nr:MULTISPECIES: hypothetical protein [Methylobacterium]TXN25047.1 hypothetical protein FV217_00445 [Methylobacterium sp. WL9]
MLVALLCVLTTALFALADASASKAAPSGSLRSRVETAFTSEGGRDLPSTYVSGRAVADSDNPFEHGRLPLADAGVPALCLASSRSVVTGDTGPVGAERPLPERPPRH